MQMQVTPKRQKFLNANGRTVRLDGKVYRIISNASTAGGTIILANAEQIFPKVTPAPMVDLMGRTNLAISLGNLVEKGLIS